MIKKLIIGIFSSVALIANSQSQGLSPYAVADIDWRQDNSSTDAISASPNAVDANNNVFAAGFIGFTNKNLVVFKYDSLGTQKYYFSFDNGGYDAGKTLKIDAAGNAYVGGTSENLVSPTSGKDYVIIKLSPTGSQLWATPYDQTNDIDEANSICFDNNGDVYVTGKSKGLMGYYNLVTLKLDGNTGSIIWQHTYVGSTLDDEGIAIAVSPNGLYVYVGGNTTDPTNGTDMVIFALYASSGTTFWASPLIINGSANGNDKLSGLIMSGSDVVICGEKNNSSLDYAICYINGSSGSASWHHDYDNSGKSNRATALATDSAGNFAIVGTLYNGSTYDYHTVLYNHSGVQYAVNIEPTGESTLMADPKIANDTLAAHWYVSGEISNITRDMYAYQITPTGNTAWKQSIDGVSYNTDAATGIAVNGVGVVYLIGQTRSASGYYNYTTVKLNQTPVYFPPDPLTTEKPNVNHLYYENKGQVVWKDTLQACSEILFSTMDYFYPTSYYTANRISYKLFGHDSSGTGTDTTQRIDISMVGSNQWVAVHPLIPNHGTVSYMQQGLPDAVTGIQGYERYFIPNVYPYIDLHYYSNGNGMKMYYVLKPYADIKSILWQIDGANSTALVGDNLVIQGINKQIVFDKPAFYKITSMGLPDTISSAALSWYHVSGNQYELNMTGSYNPMYPVVVEIDYGNPSASASSSGDNLKLLTYYGSSQDDGITDIDVDPSNGDYVTLGLTRTSNIGTPFPTINGTQLSTNTNTTNLKTDITVVVFNNMGIRKAANTYGGIANMNTSKVLLNGNHITVVGNCGTLGALPTYSSATSLAANSYTTNTTGEGYVIQFETSLVPGNSSFLNINNVTWIGRLNGYASDIDITPDRQHIYITSSTDITPTDTKTVTGAYNLTTHYGSITGNVDFQVSKFDASGVRLWSTIIPMTNSQNTTYSYNSFGNNSNVLTSDISLKCRIACDNYGFYLAGEANNNVYASISKYGAPVYPWVGGKQAFFARFNKKDSIVYLGQFGGFFDEAFNDIAVLGPNKVVVTGYSTSWDSYQSNLVPTPNGIEYIDTTIVHGANGTYIYPKLYVATFDSVGHRTWGTFYGSNGSGQGCVGWGVASDNLGRIYVTGKDTGGYTAPIINPANVYNQTTTTESEAFMVCFGFNNNPVWNTPVGGARNEIGLDLEYNANTGYMIIGGITNSNESTSPTFPVYKDASFPSNTWYQGNLNPGNAFFHDGFVGFFKSSVITGVENYYKDPAAKDVFQLFPNPAQSECTLAFKQGLKGQTKIEVYDQLGRLVIIEEEPDVLPHNVFSLQTGRLPNGLYIVKVTNENYTGSQKLIISK